jgi:hypothetical protein
LRLGACVAMCAGTIAFAQEQQGQPQQGQPPVQPQQTQLPAPQQQPAAPVAPASEHKPGAAEAFGRWFDESAAGMRKGFDQMWKGMGTASKDTADVAGAMTKGTVDAAKGTVDALGKLGGSRVISGRERCLLAPNGAPDCQAAATKICKAAGYSTGASADFVTSEECPATAYANGRKPAPGECPIEHVVIKAVCSQ